MSQVVDGKFLWLRCSNCSAEFPDFVFSGDTDMATDDLRASTDLKSNTLYIYRRSEVFPGGQEVDFISTGKKRSFVGGLIDALFDREDSSGYRCISCHSGIAKTIEHISRDDLGTKGYSLVMPSDIKFDPDVR